MTLQFKQDTLELAYSLKSSSQKLRIATLISGGLLITGWIVAVLK